MLHREQLERLRTPAQDILDNKKDFEKEVRPPIEAVAQEMNTPLHGFATRKFPTITAFSHAIATQAMATIEQTPQTDLPQAATGLESLEQYLSLTRDLDVAAGEKAVDELQHLGATAYQAYQYQRSQMDAYYAFITNQEPDALRKRGRRLPPQSLFEGNNLVLSPTRDNAEKTTLSLIISEALRICLREGSLPESKALGQELRSEAPSLANLTSVPSQVFSRIATGREYAQNNFRQVKNKQAEPDSSPWPAILQAYLSNGDIPAKTREVGQVLRAERPLASTRRMGRCAAQLTLHPYENPAAPGANAAVATSYFVRHSVKLEDGSFKTGDYTVLRGIEVAELTLFSHPECRLALEALARHIKGE